MNCEPSRYKDPSQQSWMPTGNPGDPRNSGGQGYNVGPNARFLSMSPSVPVTQAAMPPWPNAATPPPSFLLALLSFPLLVLTTYVWPAPASFARHKQYANWGVLVILLALLALISGIVAYAWGRVPSLSQGIWSLSLNRVVPHQLSSAFAVTMALVTPLLVLAFAGILHYIAHTQQGQGSYRAQLYSLLIIEAPLALFLLIASSSLLIMPALGAVGRIPLAVAGIMLLLYSLLLFIPSLMAVQGLSFGKALLCLVSILVVVLLLVAFVSILFDGWDTSNNHGGGTNNRHFKRSRKRRERICPHCNFSLEVYDQLHKTLTRSCPRCGGPLA